MKLILHMNLSINQRRRPGTRNSFRQVSLLSFLFPVLFSLFSWGKLNAPEVSSEIVRMENEAEAEHAHADLFSIFEMEAAPEELPLPVMETLPAGTLIIPMDNSLQATGGQFNLRAYGLVVYLLHAEIPLKWIISPTKGKDGTDLTASARLKAPTTGSYASRSFKAGPIAIYPGFESQAMTVINNFNAGGTNVNVYELQFETMNVPVYTDITHKPKVAVLDDGGKASIHSNILDAAGLTEGTHYETTTADALTDQSCFTVATEPHSEFDDATKVTNVKNFVQNGGNFLAQCAAGRSYQGNATAIFQGNGFVDETEFTTFAYDNFSEPFAQFQGVLANEGGSLQDFGFNTDPSGGTRIVYNPSDPDQYKAYVARLSGVTTPTGGYAHFLGSHDYSGNDVGHLNGQRMLMNAVIRPATRPDVCNLNLGPQAVNDIGYIDCGSSVTVDVLDNDTNPLGGTLSVTLLGSGTYGDFSYIGNGMVTYTPDPGAWPGPDMITYRICAGTICSEATITIRGLNDGSIAGTVFDDLNGNGALNGGEPGDQGVNVFLYEDDSPMDGNPDGPAIQTATTDANGEYNFSLTNLQFYENFLYNRRVTSSSDDAYEEVGGKGDGNMHTTDADLPVGNDDALTGLRFTNINLPGNAIINSAFLYFDLGDQGKGDVSDVGGTVTIRAQNSNNAGAFTTTDNNISSRSTTSSSVNWTIGAWTENTSNVPSADLATIIQEVVNNNGGLTRLALIISSTDVNGFDGIAYDDISSQAPRLVIDYDVPTGGPYNFIVSVDQTDLPAGVSLTTPSSYQVTFTQSGALFCDNDFGYEALCVDPPDAGTNGSRQICEGETSLQNLYSIITGEDAGGTWTETTSGTPSGVTIGNGTAVNFSNVVPGTYQFTYTVTALNCPTDMSTATITVNPAPNDNLAVGDAVICAGNTATITVGSTQLGVRYQLRLNSNDSNVGSSKLGTGGTISFTVTPSATTVYNVLATNTTTNCTTELIDKSTVTVNPNPNIGLAVSDDVICVGETGTISVSNSQSGVSYQLRLNSNDNLVGSPISGTGGTISFNVSPTSTTVYNVLATYQSTSCSAELTDKGTITVNPNPNIGLAVSDDVICVGETGMISVMNSQTGVSYQLRLNSNDSPVGSAINGTGGTITFNVSPSTTTIYNILAMYQSTGCSVELTDKSTVTVNPLPNITLAVGDDAICAGEMATITVANSQSGVNYQLRLNSNDNPVGSPKTGTGGTISFSVSPSSTTVYNVLATYQSTGCSAELTDKSTVTVNPLPNDVTALGDDICEGETATISVLSSQSGVSYQLRLNSNDNPVGSPVSGTGGTITFSVSPSSTTTYNILATNVSTNCYIELSDLPVVTVNSTPLDRTVSGDEICAGEMATITVVNSQVGVDYQLRLDANNSNVGSPVAGTGGIITFTVSPSSTTIYNILASNSAAGCSRELTSKPTVTVNPNPSIGLAVSDDVICAGETAMIRVFNTQVGVNYQLRLESNDNSVGAPIPGTGGTITFNVTPATTTTYNILATYASSGCSVELITKPTVTVNPLPNGGISVTDGVICEGGTATINVNLSETGVNYVLRLESNNSIIGGPIAGTGGTVSFNVSPSATTTYNILATVEATGCYIELNDKSTVTVNPNPNTGLAVSDAAICIGQTGMITVSNSQVGVNYQLRLDVNDSNVGSVVAGTGGNISFSVNPATTTVYNVLATYAATGCSAELTDKSTVTVNPDPNISLTVSDPEICVGETATITISNSQTGVNYRLRLDANDSNVGTLVPGNGGNISFYVSPSTTTIYNVLATYANTGCYAELTDKSTVTVTPRLIAGDDNSDGLCAGDGANYDLTTLLSGDADAGGTWAQIPSPTINISDPTNVDFSTAAPGTYVFTYTQAATGACPADVATFTITITNQLTAGDDNTDVFCEGTGTNYNLNSLLVNADPGGVWAEQGAPSVDISMPTNVDFSSVAPGLYTFTYTHAASGSCIEDQAVFMITITEQKLAGDDNSTSFCESYADGESDYIETNTAPTIDLDDLRSGTYDEGGIWSQIKGPGILTIEPGNLVDFNDLPAPPGEYQFSYTQPATGGCPADVAIITITVYEFKEAGEGGATDICEGEGANFDLNSLISGGEPGGNWIQTQGSTINISNPANVNFSTALPDTYRFTYSHSTNGDCPGDITSVTVYVSDQLSAGNDGVLEICEGETDPVDLFGIITGEDADVVPMITQNTSVTNPGEALDGFNFNGAQFDQVGDKIRVTFPNVMPAGTQIQFTTIGRNGGSNIRSLEITEIINTGPIAYPNVEAIIHNSDNTPLTTVYTLGGRTNYLELEMANNNGGRIDLDYIRMGGLWTETTAGTPSGVMIGNAMDMDFSSAAPGMYEFTYTIAGNNACPSDMATATITVTSGPADNLAVSDDVICAGETATITITGSQSGISYQLRLDSDDSNVGSPIIGTGGNISFNVSPGFTTTYNILATNTNTGCFAELLDKPTITVNPYPNSTLVVSDAAVCAGETGMITVFNSQVGVEYQLRLDANDNLVGSAVVGTGGNITFSVTPASTTTYNVYATYTSSGCAVELTDKPTVTVNAAPNIGLTVSGDDICAGEMATISVFNSELGVNYRLRLDANNNNVGGIVAGTGGNITFTVSPSATTVYNILATNATTGCFVQLTNKATVTVTPSPNALLSVSDDVICAGETAIIRVFSSQSGVNYQLRLDDGDTPVGSPIAGTGGNITFMVTPSSTTTYNVLATYGNSDCSVELSDKSTVTVNPSPSDNLSVSGDEICLGESGTITLSNSEAGVLYQLRLDVNDDNVGSPIVGDGNDIMFTVSPSATTTYNILATNTATGCFVELVNKPTVTVNPNPLSDLVVSDDEICEGETAMITIFGSQSGVNYQLRLDGNDSNVGTAVAGTGGNITINVSPSVTTTYNILATDAISGCFVELVDKPTVGVSPPPSDGLVTSDDVICAGEIATITVFNTELNVVYQLRNDSDDSDVGSPIVGTGAAINFNVSPSTTTTYNVLATNANTGCFIELLDKPTVTVNPLPNHALAVSDDAICPGESATITVSNSQANIVYQLRLDANDGNVGGPVVGTGGAINFSVSPSSTTAYNILATNLNTGCFVELLDKPTVTVTPLPNKNLLASDDVICQGENASILLFNTQVGVQYQLRLETNDNPVGSPIVGTGSFITFNVTPSGTTTYNILATNTSSGCFVELTDKPIVTVNPSPTNTLPVSDDEICAGEVAVIKLFNSQSGIFYQLRLDSDDTDVGSPIVGTGGDITFSVSPSSTTTYKILARNSNTDCTAELLDKPTVTVSPLPTNNQVVGDDIVCAGATASILLFNSEVGVSYQLRLDDNDFVVGAPIAGTGSNIMFQVTPSITTTYNILATNSTTGCSAELVDKPTVTVNPNPNQNLVVSDDGICVGEPATITVFNSQSGVRYQLRLDSDDSNVGAFVLGNGGDISFMVSPSTTTTYNVLASYFATSCAVELLDKPTVTVSPTPSNILPVTDDNICEGETATIRLLSSELNVLYQLVLDSNDSNVGTAKSGTGGEITFAVTPSITTVYYIIATNTITGCTTQLIDKSTVTVSPEPMDNLAVSDDVICFGEMATISVSNSQVGVNYLLRRDADDSVINGVIPGDGGTISFTFTPSATAVYNIQAINAISGCSVELLDKSTVTVNPLPNNALVVSDDQICIGEDATIMVINSEVGVNYQLRLESNDNSVGGVVAGTGGNISFTLSPATTTTYKVLATNATTGCFSELLDKPTVTVNPLPVTTYNVTDGAECNGDVVTLTMDGSQIGVSYQLRLDADDSNVGSPVSGTGGPINFMVSPTMNTTYNILATYDATGCAAELPDKPTVTIYELPDNSIPVSDDEICVGETAQITISNSQIGVRYQLRLDVDDTPVSSPIFGNGGNIIVLISPTITTQYNVFNVQAVNLSTNCESELLDKPTVTVNDLPEDGLAVGDDDICLGETAEITVANSEVGVSYQLRLESNDALVGSAVVGTGGTIMLTAMPTSTTVYNVYATNTSTGCTVELLDKSTVTVTVPLEAGENNSDGLCVGGGASYDLTALLSIDADAGGTWNFISGPSTIVLTNPMSVDFSSALAGNYLFTYTHAANGPCPADQATFMITITDQLSAGDDNTDSFCEGMNADYNLNSLLVGADPGGTWAQTEGASLNLSDPTGVDFSGAAPGDYIFTYTHAASGSCLEDQAEFKVTVEDCCLTVETYVYLEGGVVESDGTATYSLPMRTDLSKLGLLPGQVYENFFLGNHYTPAGQPYDQAPWNYFGTEGALFDSGGNTAMADAGYPATVVDWVLVSLRSDPNGTGGPLCQAAALLHNDGHIEFVDDFDCCDIDLTGSYYLVIEHRNHLIIMSQDPVQVVNGVLTYDFRINQSYIESFGGFGTFVGQKQVSINAQTVYMMYGGNGNQTLTGTSDTDINFDDRTFWEIENGIFGRYRIGDYNLNGDVNFNDRTLWEFNNGRFTSVPRN